MKYTFLMVFSLLIGCYNSNSKTKISDEKSKKEFLGCKDSIALNKFFQSLIDDKLISENLYTPHVDSVGYLSMRKIDKYPFGLNLKKFEKDVKIFENEKRHLNTPFIHFENINLYDDTLYVKVTYDALNVSWQFKFLKENECSWKKISEKWKSNNKALFLILTEETELIK
jgi:hypothetical protein